MKYQGRTCWSSHNDCHTPFPVLHPWQGGLSQSSLLAPNLLTLRRSTDKRLQIGGQTTAAVSPKGPIISC